MPSSTRSDPSANPTMSHRTCRHHWSTYLQQFHAERPGITERILTRCRADGLDPYEWCAQPLADRTRAGPGPRLRERPDGRPARRLDRRRHLSRRTGRRPGAPTGAPCSSHPPPAFRSARGALAATACSMGLQIIEPMAAALAEVARVLRPGGRPPCSSPPADRSPGVTPSIYARLQIALRRRLHYPNDGALRPAPLRQALRPSAWLSRTTSAAPSPSPSTPEPMPTSCSRRSTSPTSIRRASRRVVVC